jgi:hypothetical protein
LDGPASLDELSIHGPKAELDKVKPGTEALGTTYYEIYGGVNNMVKESGETKAPMELCTIQPTFTVKVCERGRFFNLGCPRTGIRNQS